MSWRSAIITVVLLAMCLEPASAADQEAGVIEGKVVEIRICPSNQASNGQLCDELLVRTNRGEDVRVCLGMAGTSEGMVQSGDRVRICPVGNGPAGGACRAQWMKVRRTGATYPFRDPAGEPVGDRDRARLRDGSCGGNGPGNGTGGGERRRDGSCGGTGPGDGAGGGGERRRDGSCGGSGGHGNGGGNGGGRR